MFLDSKNVPLNFIEKLFVISRKYRVHIVCLFTISSILSRARTVVILHRCLRFLIYKFGVKLVLNYFYSDVFLILRRLRVEFISFTLVFIIL